jgi:hypothetical protein
VAYTALVNFAIRQARLRALEALELRVKQFRSRDGIWPFRVPHEPLDLDEILDRAAEGDAPARADTLRSRTVLEFLWHTHRWELWVIALPSGILLYCDADGQESRVLASAKRGNPGEADGFFLERLAQSRGREFGIEMAGPAPERVRSSIGDRDFLADVLVEMFEGTEAAAGIGSGGDFHDHVVRWLDQVLTAPPPGRRQPRVSAVEPL